MTLKLIIDKTMSEHQQLAQELEDVSVVQKKFKRSGSKRPIYKRKHTVEIEHCPGCTKPKLTIGKNEVEGVEEIQKKIDSLAA